jgi:hypothetical protein
MTPLWNKESLYQKGSVMVIAQPLINCLIAHDCGTGVIIIKFFILNALFPYERYIGGLWDAHSLKNLCI